MENVNKNPLGYENVGKLMVKFAVPSIVAMLVGAIYNIVDQFFIGQSVGPLGNAATNIAFPLSILCTSMGLVFGIGGSASFNISMGAGDSKRAVSYVGNAITMIVTVGIVIMIFTLLFLEKLLIAFGSPSDVLPYAKDYVGVSAFGFPFLILTIGGGHLIRADGRPRITMLCNMSGAIINVFLDALFVMILGWGMKGAALATVMGQIFSGCLAIRYLIGYQTVKIKLVNLIPKFKYLRRVVSLGTASFFNQIAMMIVQVVSNNILSYYGALSIYGAATPIACAGIGAKINQIFMAVVIGTAQGTQPIESFNFGAKQYDRVIKAYKIAIVVGVIVSSCFFLVFQLFPRQIIGLFGHGDENYFTFGIKYLRIYMLFTALNFMQPITSNFFTAIGKAYKGMFLSLTRQILFLLPLIVFLPMKFGVEGVLFAGPIADLVAFCVNLSLVIPELMRLKKGVED